MIMRKEVQDRSWYESRIFNLREDREKFINLKNASYAEGKEKDYPEIDFIAEKILEMIRENLDLLNVDFVLEELSHLGWAPQLLYDDNGHWAITDTGFQSVSVDDEPSAVSMAVVVMAEEWKTSPRKALEHYLKEDDDDE